MEQEIVYKVTKTDFVNAISDVINEHQNAFDRFYSVFVDGKTVAKIHGLSSKTISRYVAEGVIVPDPTSGRVHKFRLSEVLKMDFTRIKYRRRYERCL